jgi:hypothetical protein
MVRTLLSQGRGFGSFSPYIRITFPRSVYCFILTMEARGFSEILLKIYQTTCHIAEGSHLKKYCHVFQWLRRGFRLVNRFVGSSLVVTTISSYTLKITVTIAHVTSHTKSSNSSSGHTAVPLELRSSREVNSHSRILSYPLGTDNAQKTQLYCCVAQTTQESSHAITISPVHWRAECCLATSYNHSSYCCVRVSRSVYRVVAWQCVNMSQ